MTNLISVPQLNCMEARMKAKISIILLALMAVAFLVVAPAAADLKAVPMGGVVFVGEEGLTLTMTPGVTSLEWYAPGSNPVTDAPSATYTVGAKNVIDPATFQNRLGNWYEGAPSAKGTVVAMNVKMPSIDVKVFDAVTGKDMSNGRVVKGTKLAFRLDSNLFEVATKRPVAGGDLQNTEIKVVVIGPEGATYTALVDDARVPTTSSLTGADPVTGTKYGGLIPDSSQYYVPGTPAAFVPPVVIPPNWDLDSNQYKAGVYTFYAEVNLNNAKDNVGTVTGVTKSAVKTIEVGKDDVKLTANKDTVVRNNDFTVTITGRPNQPYVLWVKGTSSIAAPDTVPYIKANQEGVAITDPLANAYRFTGSAGAVPNVGTDVPALLVPPVPGDYYAMVTLSSSGTRTVGFGTDDTTKDQTYTIRTDLYQAPAIGTSFSPTYDTLKVKVEKGSVTISASGDSQYYIGEEIVLSGTNTDSANTWLFITGPNLDANGAPFFNTRDGVRSFDALTNPGTLTRLGVFWAPVSVETDDTWEYKWNTGMVNLDAGTYTVYAVTTPAAKGDFGAMNAIYKTASVVIKKPFVTATSSSLTVARGDDLYIKGTAEGDPAPGVAIWILGKNYVVRSTETIEDDGSFEFKFSGTDTLAAGQYFVVVQHPMENDQFDLDTTLFAGATWVQKVQTGVNLFPLDGPGSLQGSEAATALVNAMNSPDIDDTYYKLTFMVEEPWIVINAIGDKHVGDSFTISGTTNLAVGDNLIVEATSASFKPTDKTQSSGFVGAAGTVSVTAGDKDGVNNWEFNVDTASFIPDQYIVTVEAIEASLVGTQTFNVMKAEPTTKPTAPVETPTATVTPVKTAEPTPEQTAPGFGVLVALIGLGAVAALIVRRD